VTYARSFGVGLAVAAVILVVAAARLALGSLGLYAGAMASALIAGQAPGQA
jgi:hypothetical protein